VTTQGYRPLLQRRTGTTGSSRPVVTLLHLSVVIFVAGGCVSLGPAAIRWERTDYNVAIQETQNEQLLLNLVRLRYSDTPILLELSSISSQLATGAGASAGAELTRSSKQPPSNLWIFGVNAQFSAQPPFDWIKATGALLRVRSTSLPPTGAVVSVSHRGNWFFIDDSDLSSKATFSLLSHLLALQSGEVQRLVPLLTLPVGR
jgi:hypothetical protein